MFLVMLSTTVTSSNLQLKKLKLMFKFCPLKPSKKLLLQSKEILKFKIMLVLELIQFLLINILFNHTFNLFNKEKTLTLNGLKKKIKLLITPQLPKKLFINKEVELNKLMSLVMFTTHKKLLNQPLTEKKFKFNSNKLQHKKLLFNQFMKILNTLILKKLKELLYLTLFKKKFQLEYLNQLFMMYLYINMNMFLSKNLVILVVVMTKTMQLLVSLISSTLLKLK